MENELRDLGNLDFFGLLKADGDRERVMEQIDVLRAKTLYSHSAEDCSERAGMKPKYTQMSRNEVGMNTNMVG